LATSVLKPRGSALVISRKSFNQHTGFAIVAPITSTKRGTALEIELSDTTMQGVVLIHQLRSLNVEARKVTFIEKAPAPIIDKATKMSVVIIQ